MRQPAAVFWNCSCSCFPNGVWPWNYSSALVTSRRAAIIAVGKRVCDRFKSFRLLERCCFCTPFMLWKDICRMESLRLRSLTRLGNRIGYVLHNILRPTENCPDKWKRLQKVHPSGQSLRTSLNTWCSMGRLLISSFLKILQRGSLE